MSTKQRLTAEARREVIEHAASEVFAERGYHGASIDEIARRSGVSPPVVYDHFDSKQDLYKRLLERHQSDLLGLWREHLAGDEPFDRRMGRALSAWFDYIESHPAWLMIFREAPAELAGFHAEIRERGLAGLGPLTAREEIAEPGPEVVIATELLRSAVGGLAVWWYDNRHIPREQVVEVTMTLIWLGFERVLGGERWEP